MNALMMLLASSVLVVLLLACLALLLDALREAHNDFLKHAYLDGIISTLFCGVLIFAGSCVGVLLVILLRGVATA